MTVEGQVYPAVVVGGGAAGLRAALEISRETPAVVVSKVHPLRSASSSSRGGIPAALGDRGPDSWEWHRDATIEAGAGLVDAAAAEIMCAEAPSAVVELENYGVPFHRTPDGRVDQWLLPGHRRPDTGELIERAAFAGDQTGALVLHTLYQRCLAAGVEFLDEHAVIDVVFDDDPRLGGRAAGVVAYDIRTGALRLLQGGAVLVATGGATRLYGAGSRVSTGDGLGMLYRRGIPLQDLEMVAFDPLGLRNAGPVLTSAVLPAGAVLRDAAGDDIDGDRHLDAVAREIGERGVAALDLTGVDDDRRKLLRDTFELIERYGEAGHGPDSVRVQPVAGALLGGIPVDADGRVVVDAEGRTVPGLYATGACAATGVHGARALPGNALLEAVVFGRRVGQQLASFVRDAGYGTLPDGSSADAEAMVAWLRAGKGTEPVAPMRRALQETLNEHVGAVRSADGLVSARNALTGLLERYGQVRIDDRSSVFNTALVEAVELGFMIDVAQSLVEAANDRDTTLGVHVRLVDGDADGDETSADADHSLVFASGDDVDVVRRPSHPPSKKKGRRDR